MRRLMIVAATMAVMIQPAAASDYYIFDAIAENVSKQCVHQVRLHGYHHFEASYNFGLVPHYIGDRYAFYWFAMCMAQNGFPLR